jgi:hypothetical protein
VPADPAAGAELSPARVHPPDMSPTSRAAVTRNSSSTTLKLEHQVLEPLWSWAKAGRQARSSAAGSRAS